MENGLQKYFALLKVIECGSFTVAASELNYTQSGISRMIRELEHSWDTVLLDRSTSPVRPSSECLEILPNITDLCSEYRSLQTKIQEINGLQAGKIRIGTFSSVATHWLPNIIREFQKEYPGIDYEIVSGYADEIEAWLLDKKVDCGFTVLPCGEGLESLPLAEDRMLAILPPNHPLAALERVSAEALCQEPFMLLEKDEKEEISRILDAHALTPHLRYTVADDYAIMSMVENGLGVSILPELILNRSPYNIVTRELDPPEIREIVFAVPRKAPLSLAVQKFREYLKYR